jgi:hypothetical protein
VAFFRKCFKEPCAISIGARDIPECYFFVYVFWDAIEKICTVPAEEDAVDLHCPIATTGGEFIQILSKT